jgi:hypothetical protein
MQPTAHNLAMLDLSQNVIYLMGISFVLGSLFTVLILLLLDFMRRNNKTA